MGGPGGVEVGFDVFYRFAFTGSSVRCARAMPVLGEYNGVSRAAESRAFSVVFEFIFPFWVEAPKVAFAYLGLGSS